jgi:hypothetical protein
MKNWLIILIVIFVVLVFFGIIAAGIWVKVHNAKIYAKTATQDANILANGLKAFQHKK